MQIEPIQQRLDRLAEKAVLYFNVTNLRFLASNEDGPSGLSPDNGSVIFSRNDGKTFQFSATTDERDEKIEERLLNSLREWLASR